jgi:hypothetical protein
MTEVDLSDLPKEVSDYAFDQLGDRLTGQEDVTIAEATMAGEGVRRNYDSQTVVIDETFIGAAICRICREKIADIEYEVRHGEREDFTESDVKEIRRKLRAIQL